MTSPTVWEFDCGTGQTIERPMNADELAAWQAAQDTPEN